MQLEITTDLLYCLKKAKYKINNIEQANKDNGYFSSSYNIAINTLTKREMTYLMALALFAKMEPNCTTKDVRDAISLYGIKLGGFKPALNCCPDCLEELRDHGFVYVRDRWAITKTDNKKVDEIVRTLP